MLRGGRSEDVFPFNPRKPVVSPAIAGEAGRDRVTACHLGALADSTGAGGLGGFLPS